jgi:hypothetical protein
MSPISAGPDQIIDLTRIPDSDAGIRSGILAQTSSSQEFRGIAGRTLGGPLRTRAPRRPTYLEATL